MELRLEHICKKYRQTKALNNASLTLYPGVWGLLGANGAGKTTLMKIICALIRQDSGLILWNNANVTLKSKDYFSKISYLPQHFGVDSQFTVIDYMEYIAALKGIDKNSAADKIVILLNEVSLNNHEKMKMKNLSGGMRRRLGIAQALLNDPDILILDEPTVGLDPKERVHFRRILSEYARGKIIIISTHIVSDVEYLANQIVIMHDGEINKTGSPEKLCKQVESMVWEAAISHNQRSMLENICIVNIKSMGKDNILVRYVSEEPVIKNSSLCISTLEDIYMWTHLNALSKNGDKI